MYSYSFLKNYLQIYLSMLIYSQKEKKGINNMTDKQLYDILLAKDFTGATLDKNGLVTFEDGYQVSIEDCATFKHMPVKLIVKCIQALIKDLAKYNYIGLWLDNGTLYVDRSIHTYTRECALDIAKLTNQKAIYNWSTKESEAVK